MRGQNKLFVRSKVDSCEGEGGWYVNTERNYGIKNKSQVKTWMRWYKNNEIYRFDQPIGKQYSYGHGPDGQTEEEKKNRQMTHLKMENEILKKYMDLVKELKQK